MTDERFYNVWSWEAREFPRHLPVEPPKREAGFHCAWRDPVEDLRCGREMNYGPHGLRHNPPMGVPHPRRSA
jgi:hypothetical protein